MPTSISLRRVRLLIGQGLCGAIYTQTTDVEIEVNGLMTYDRIVAKIDIDRAYAAAQKLYLPPPEVTVLVPTSETVPQQWRYTLAEPPAGWFAPEFDDSTWQEGVGGFGRHKTPGAVVRTEWTTSDIWLRRSFDLTEVPAQGELVLLIHHDEDAEVYLNGKRLAQLSGYLTSYTAVPLSADGLGRLLRKGKTSWPSIVTRRPADSRSDVGLAVVQEVRSSKEPTGFAASGFKLFPPGLWIGGLTRWVARPLSVPCGSLCKLLPSPAGIEGGTFRPWGGGNLNH